MFYKLKELESKNPNVFQGEGKKNVIVRVKADLWVKSEFYVRFCVEENIKW